eukprot:6990799-Pyramimonas_sp.AAC.1
MLIVDSPRKYSGSKSGGRGSGQCGAVAVARGSSIRFGVELSSRSGRMSMSRSAWREWHSAALCYIAVSNCSGCSEH